MKIPRRVDRAWGWLERRFATTLVALVALVASGTLVAGSVQSRPVSISVAAAFVLGGVAAGVLVHTRMARRLGRARVEVEELLRENGALRHRNTVLAGGVIARGTEVTRQLVTMADTPPPRDRGGTLPLPGLEEAGGGAGTTAPGVADDAGSAQGS